jgi:hypothetical protein
MPLDYVPIPEDLWEDWLWLVKAEGLQLEIREGPLRLGTSQFALMAHYTIHVPKLVLHIAATGGWFDSEGCRSMIELALITAPLTIVAGGDEGTYLGLDTIYEGRPYHMRAVFGCLRGHENILAVIPATGPAETVALVKGSNFTRSTAMIMKTIETMLEKGLLQPALEGWVISYQGHRISEIEPLEFLSTRCDVMKLDPEHPPILENVPDQWS